MCPPLIGQFPLMSNSTARPNLSFFSSFCSAREVRVAFGGTLTFVMKVVKQQKKSSVQLLELAGDVLHSVNSKKGSLKNLTFGNESVNARQRRLLFALVDQTNAYMKPLSFVYDSLFSDGASALGFERESVLILLYQMLVTRSLLSSLECDGRVSRILEDYKVKCEALISEFCNANSLDDIRDWKTPERSRQALVPRYARVNHVLSGFKDVVKHLSPNFERAKGVTPRNLGPRQFMVDEHLGKELLVFPPRTDLHACPLVLQGKLILQDKASCLPAYLLAPPPGAHVVDCCAAPGNKTTHLVSTMRNKGHVYAFDRSPERYKLLQGMVGRSGANSITQCILADFLEYDLESTDWADSVTHVLCDPSCSGSGIGHTEEMKPERLLQLAEFQFKILCKSLSFPNVKRVSYSTCSVNALENEYVVSLVLAQNPDFCLASKDVMLPSWTRRGKPFSRGDLAAWGIEDPECPGLSKEQADCCIQCLPSDLTNGFFLAIFERVAESS